MADEYDNSPLPSPASAWQAGDGVPIPGPEGPQGPTGPAPNLAIGTVTQGTTAQATITGINPNYSLNLVLPQGPAGSSGNPGGNASLSIGTVSTLPAGSVATATITGTPPSQQLNLGIPTGAQGPIGVPGVASVILLGNGAPSNALGNANDVYINLLTGDMYGPKNATTGWGPIVGNFKGIPDAPADGKLYGRKDNAWVEIVIPTT